MGNYCTSGQSKKDRDNTSQKSEESATYQCSNKNKKSEKGGLKAPLADPEPVSDISNLNANLATTAGSGNTNNGNLAKFDSNDTTKPSIKAIQGIHSTTYDSTSSSPLTVTAPCEIPALISTQPILPANLTLIYGKPTQSRRTENDKKIVLYIIAADDSHKTEKEVLSGLYSSLQDYCACRGFELQLCNTQEQNDNLLDPSCWIKEPLEARGGHHTAAKHLSEIARYSNLSYIIPVLFLGTSLGSPLLPLTIESQDFKSSCESAAEGSEDKTLLERWYILDEKAEPPCYCLKTNDISVNNETAIELNRLYNTLVNVFSKELCDSYLTSVIEQEINNTVLISQELSKRCIWVHTGVLPTKNIDTLSGLDAATIEINRRLNNIQAELKNQLCEKNLIRIPPSVQVSNEVLGGSLCGLITANIDAIVDDHINKYQIPYCTYGVDRNHLAEIEAVNQYSKLLNQNCANFGIMDSIKSYIISPTSEPLVIFGRTGSGKSALSAKVAQFVHSWLPDCCLIMRYTRLTPLSSDVVSLLGSIAEQILYFTKTEPYTGSHSIQSYTDTIKACVDSTKHQVVILIDSLDEALQLKNLDWLPTKLTEQVKIIITTTSNISHIDECKGANELILWSLKDRISKTNFIHLKQFSDEQWNEVLSYGGGDFYTSNIQLELPETWKSCADKIPLQAKIFWWLAWLGEINLADISLDSICNKLFEIIEDRFGKEIIKFIVSLIITSRDGLCETEVIQLLESSKLCSGSVSQLWLDFCWIMSRGPILLHLNYVKLMDNKLKSVAEKRYRADIKRSHEILYQHYLSQSDITADKSGKYQTYNIRKFIELPYHAYKIDEKTSSSSSSSSLSLSSSFDKSVYLSDLNWIQSKLKATKCVQYILNDIFLLDKHYSSKANHLELLQKFFEYNIRPINYDADQFYPLLKHFMSTSFATNAKWSKDAICQKWSNDLETISISYLDIINQSDVRHKADENEDEEGYDAIINLGGDGHFVASLSTQREEISVWNVPSCQKVRVLKGIPQPAALCPVDDYGAAVLCRREIKIIDLNRGTFRVTLKGVMNQKMPYFAYCNDAQHLICLSRNRMYVNLMNLTSGDCITTFKAGEDRFLNSLLVSGDGRILVCGDETQKPFPLLVWHLSQRKLLYDLRIPHHDFLTSLSAITHEGSYVCVVAKELNEPAPNFIVVYDLQSGTLFKKWKPTCNTVSLSISQTNACVVAGLEDARILIWDLVTGNCKYVLTGHTAPVTLLKLDPRGKVLLSLDKEGRDRSVRLWELSTGEAIAVHTPPKKITTCEILSLGKYIVLALENQPNLVTLELKNSNKHVDQNGDSDENETDIYGDEENDGKVFQL